jgi:hypothetical protein
MQKNMDDNALVDCHLFTGHRKWTLFLYTAQLLLYHLSSRKVARQNLSHPKHVAYPSCNRLKLELPSNFIRNTLCYKNIFTI